MASLALLCAAVLNSAPSLAQSTDELAEQVRRTEIAFAQTMADRDLDTFLSFVAEEAIFFGDQSVLRGAQAVRQAWAPFFEDESAPFSWKPESVQVLDSGTLALSSGPVLDSGGRRIGTFNSVWRLDAEGRWKVIFDKGCPPCRKVQSTGQGDDEK